MTLKIEKAMEGACAVFTLSGGIKAEHVAELQSLFDFEPKDRSFVLDLKEVQLVDRDTVKFLAGCEAAGILIENCPAYIREWIEREKN